MVSVVQVLDHCRAVGGCRSGHFALQLSHIVVILVVHTVVNDVVQRAVVLLLLRERSWSRPTCCTSVVLLRIALQYRRIHESPQLRVGAALFDLRTSPISVGCIAQFFQCVSNVFVISSAGGASRNTARRLAEIGNFSSASRRVECGCLYNKGPRRSVSDAADLTTSFALESDIM